MGRDRRSTLGAAFVASALAASAILVIPASATPGSGFTVSSQPTGVLSATHFKADKDAKWDLNLKTKDDSTVGVDLLSLVPGAQSGWHTHTGMTLVTVTSGEVQWYDGADPVCAFKTYRAGDSFIEPNNHPHLVRNATSSAASIAAVQIRPAGTGGRIDVSVKPTNCPSF